MTSTYTMSLSNTHTSFKITNKSSRNFATCQTVGTCSLSDGIALFQNGEEVGRTFELSRIIPDISHQNQICNLIKCPPKCQKMLPPKYYFTNHGARGRAPFEFSQICPDTQTSVFLINVFWSVTCSNFHP